MQPNLHRKRLRAATSAWEGAFFSQNEASVRASFRTSVRCSQRGILYLDQVQMPQEGAELVPCDLLRPVLCVGKSCLEDLIGDFVREPEPLAEIAPESAARPHLLAL